MYCSLSLHETLFTQPSKTIVWQNQSKYFFLNKFCRTQVLFVGPLIPLFWSSGDVCPGFQSQGGFPHLRASLPAHNRFLRFTSGATPAFSTNRVYTVKACTWHDWAGSSHMHWDCVQSKYCFYSNGMRTFQVRLTVFRPFWRCPEKIAWNFRRGMHRDQLLQKVFCRSLIVNSY